MSRALNLGTIIPIIGKVFNFPSIVCVYGRGYCFIMHTWIIISFFHNIVEFMLHSGVCMGVKGFLI